MLVIMIHTKYKKASLLKIDTSGILRSYLDFNFETSTNSASYKIRFANR